jgi:tetratricopeptide (TPR) repeat protein
MFDHYTHTAHAADAVLRPQRDPMELPLTQPASGTTVDHPPDHERAMAWLTAEHAVLVAAIQRSAAQGLDTHAWQLTCAVTAFLGRRGYWDDRVTIWQTALLAAQRLSHPDAYARAHRGLANAYLGVGRDQEARDHLHHALRLDVKHGNHAAQATTHRHLGLLHLQAGDPRQALHHAQQAVELFEVAGNRRAAANALNSVGWTYAELGEHDNAVSHCERALTMLQQLGDQHGQAATWDSLGYAHHHLGHHARAADCYHHAIELHREAGSRYLEADSLHHLGETHHAVGDLTAAGAAYERALRILTELDNPEADAVRAKLDAVTG